MKRRRILFAILLSILQAFLINIYSQSAYIPPEKPKLIVGIIVEQLRYDLLEQYRSKLSDDGIKVLINEGTYYQNASYEYMLTQSDPAHATIATGAEPAVHTLTG